VLVNLAAGADTTAAALRTIFYLSLKHPTVWKKLSEAVLAAPFAQPGSVCLPAPYSQARGIPYLEAVIREALRLYPGNLFPQERVVPPGGLKLPDGRYVPEGTALGFNAYAIHRNKAIWGQDAEEFRPERFFRAEGESEAAFNDRMRLYNDSDLSFGAGSRKCIGMNLAMLEVYKSVATLVAMFDFELATQEEWTVTAELFPRARGIMCRIRQRDGMSLRTDIDYSNQSS
jgi:cytochrome P450